MYASTVIVKLNLVSKVKGGYEATKSHSDNGPEIRCIWGAPLQNPRMRGTGSALNAPPITFVGWVGGCGCWVRHTQLTSLRCSHLIFSESVT